MALANCPLCGKLFNKALRDVCPDCIRAEDEAFHTVRDYLREHKNAKPYEVSEATEVPLGTIYKFVREGRLIAYHYPGLHYECERCGAPITKGKICDDCMKNSLQHVQKLKEAVAADREMKMYNQSKSGYYSNIKNDFDKKF
ncbi:hypothetical protein LSG31_03965 [Fodinisporobacter ferrooxydans]|uniref:Flagellar protein n=1 Tax=Fodinisporobacter ferrooxydans TaxID=2901836 RepID=A0ABY4CM51_9BACL|nr:hypothetical protein LSG31_03965 [Alicyclobacillaceae bacterium MYW30-H2]